MIFNLATDKRVNWHSSNCNEYIVLNEKTNVLLEAVEKTIYLNTPIDKKSSVIYMNSREDMLSLLNDFDKALVFNPVDHPQHFV